MSDRVWIVILVVALVLAVGVTGYIDRKSWENKAVEEGHAEFYLDAEHERQWRWLPAPSKKGAER